MLIKCCLLFSVCNISRVLTPRSVHLYFQTAADMAHVQRHPQSFNTLRKQLDEMGYFQGWLRVPLFWDQVPFHHFNFHHCDFIELKFGMEIEQPWLIPAACHGLGASGAGLAARPPVCQRARQARPRRRRGTQTSQQQQGGDSKDFLIRRSSPNFSQNFPKNLLQDTEKQAPFQYCMEGRRTILIQWGFWFNIFNFLMCMTLQGVKL